MHLLAGFLPGFAWWKILWICSAQSSQVWLIEHSLPVHRPEVAEKVLQGQHCPVAQQAHLELLS